MDIKELAKKWFIMWEKGDFHNIPITENFRHTSPNGTIDGKKNYLSLVEANKDKFLGHRFDIHDEIYDEDKACVRYTAIQGDFTLEVTEWHFPRDGLIEEIIAYYNIEGEISDKRKIANYE